MSLNDADAAVINKALMALWPSADLGETDAVNAYYKELHEFDRAEVLAAIRALARDGREFVPPPGLVRRRLLELGLDAPDWATVKHHFIERRRSVGKWECPYAVCDGSSYVLAEDGDAHPCRCHAERIERSRGFTRTLHPLVREFIEVVPINEIEMTFESTTAEAQVRTKWERFIDSRLTDSTLVGIDAPNVRRIARANREALPMSEIVKKALPPGEDAA